MCDPGGIQTHDLQNRNLTLYSRPFLFRAANVSTFFQECNIEGEKVSQFVISARKGGFSLHIENKKAR